MRSLFEKVLVSGNFEYTNLFKDLFLYLSMPNKHVNDESHYFLRDTVAEDLPAVWADPCSLDSEMSDGVLGGSLEEKYRTWCEGGFCSGGILKLLFN